MYTCKYCRVDLVLDSSSSIYCNKCFCLYCARDKELHIIGINFSENAHPYIEYSNKEIILRDCIKNDKKNNGL